jgi:serine/threonine protein kinase
MGEVWLARDLKLERQVALKVLPSDLTQDPARVARFQQEARAASALNHPNVCTIYALGETPERQQFIAMEHVEGETLRHRLVRQFTLREALDLTIQIASALTAAHAAGVVHRDLKPENVMRRPDGLVKVLDFGLAKLVSLSSADAAASTRAAIRTDAGTVVGTVAYMSPEQARGQDVDRRTDIWALGVMLYEMVAGRCPFTGQSSSDVLAGILDRDPAPLARFDPDAPGELQRIVGKALRKDQEQRYQGMKDLVLDLQALRDDAAVQTRSSGQRAPSGGVDEPTPISFPADPSTARPPSTGRFVVSQLTARVPRSAAAVVVAIVLALVIVAGVFLRNDVTPDPQQTLPVVVLMDSAIPERVYDAATRQSGGTNADDITDILSDLPVDLRKETTSAFWHREHQVVSQSPALVIMHLSSFAKPTGQFDFQLDAQERARAFLGFVGAANPNTRFIVYSRGFETSPDREAWIAEVVQRFPTLRSRVWLLHVPGGPERATFRDPSTRRLVRAQVAAVLGLGGSR